MGKEEKKKEEELKGKYALEPGKLKSMQIS